MGYQFVGFLAFCFCGFTLINRVLEGQFLSSTDISYMNNLLAWRNVEVFGWFSMPIPNLSFFTEGILHLVQWDYSFFGGNASLIQYFLYSISAALAFLFFVIAIGAAYQMFSRAR